jgi:hypothetical protein
MDESNVPQKQKEPGDFFDDLLSVCHQEEPKPSYLEDPCSRFSLNKEKIHQLDGQSAKDVTDLWREANKTLYPTLTNGIFPLLGQSKDEVNTLLNISEKQGEREPGSVVEKIVVSEHTINEIKKHMQLLDTLNERQCYYTPPVCTERKKRKSKYERLKAKHACLEKRVAVLEELCRHLTEKDKPNG